MPLPDDFVHDVDLKSMKEEFKAMEAKRCKKGGGLLVLAEILANTTSRRLGLGLHDVAAPIEDQSSFDLQGCKTVMGRKDFFVTMARGRQVEVLAKMWDLLEDPDFILRMDFLRRSEVHGPTSLDEDKVVSRFVFDFALNLTAQEQMSDSFYMDRPPYLFMGYLSHDEGDRNRVLTWAKDANEALGVYEPLMAADEELKALVAACFWPSQPWVREALISVSECNNKRMGPQIEADLELMAQSIGVKAIEDTHRILNVAARQNINNKLSRASRWNACACSGVLTENEIKPPRVHDVDKVEARKLILNNRSYEVEGKAGKFSLGADVYKQLLEKDPPRTH